MSDALLYQRLAWHISERMPPAAHGGRTLLVTSALPGEGKTHIAEHLAVALVEQTGAPVALVTCAPSDRRNVAPPGGGPSWSEIVRMGLPAAFQSELLADATVTRIPFGDGDPSLVFRAAEMTGAVDALRQRFGFVMLDGPVLENCGVLSACADSSVLIVNAARSRREAVQASLKYNRSAAKKLLGTVLNERPAYGPRWLNRLDVR